MVDSQRPPALSVLGELRRRFRSGSGGVGAFFCQRRGPLGEVWADAGGTPVAFELAALARFDPTDVLAGVPPT
eukprot:CAMPEP_0184081062 /NCGR_PEP_ID=MMETSP0974-20121125/2515_1 /TAXON_ID=483370 /ORGANISM="non described non described, Strain CCMP2097" /LENGTH=72 /DNA_ID=CAMNT_0026383731 /DNA_START=30 /DNA_END=248 /DNA_ORIENTATION=-